MINVFGEEKFRPVKKLGVIVPNYYVSRDGEIYSKHSNKILSPGKSSSNCGTKYTVSLHVDKDSWNGYTYRRSHQSNSLAATATVHRLVMDAWKPIDDHPPEPLSSEWNQVITPEMVGQPRIPESYKQWIRDTAIIDHINDDPSDNRVENLRWCTPLQNSYHRKKREFVEPSDEKQ